jgi:hypothetical protein
MQHETLELTKLLTVGLLRLNLCLHRAREGSHCPAQGDGGALPTSSGRGQSQSLCVGTRPFSPIDWFTQSFNRLMAIYGLQPTATVSVAQIIPIWLSVVPVRLCYHIPRV